MESEELGSVLCSVLDTGLVAAQGREDGREQGAETGFCCTCEVV